jgi:hypothetical protein
MLPRNFFDRIIPKFRLNEVEALIHHGQPVHVASSPMKHDEVASPQYGDSYLYSAVHQPDSQYYQELSGC